MRNGFDSIGVPVPYRTSPFAIFLVSALACTVPLTWATPRYPLLKESGIWQFGLWVALTLVAWGLLTLVIRRVEAGMARRRAERGLPPRVATESRVVVVFGVLLFGGGGLFMAWSAVRRSDPGLLGQGALSCALAYAIGRSWPSKRRR